MIEETAIVVKCEGKFAWVEAQRQTTCGNCAASKGCGTSVLAKVVGKKAARMRALNPIEAQLGDTSFEAVLHGFIAYAAGEQ